MTDQRRGAGRRRQEEARRIERANRILDAAATLILRWGYNKTTIDDIAREAGVAKGTIYLHWKTREDLFGALMKRERIELGKDLSLNIMADPAGCLPRGIFRHTALALMKRPLLKAVLLRDLDVLGKLARSEHASDSYLERLVGFQTYLEFLRERDLVRTDLSPRAQVYTLSAVFMGFLLIKPLVPNELALADEEVADLIAETVHRTLESERSVSADELRNASRRFAQYVEHAVAAEEELLWQSI